MAASKTFRAKITSAKTKQRNKKFAPINLEQATEICRALQQAGYEAYFVGGIVRDFLAGRDFSKIDSAHSTSARTTTDIDITTSAKPEEIKRILKKLRLRFFDAAEKFGTIVAIPNIEITTFRQESDYKDSRRPSRVKFITTAAEDSNRRDFTIGAIYLDPITGEIQDFHGGLKDLQARRLQFILDPAKRIKEDPLRMLRAARFATTLNLTIAPRSQQAIKKHAALIKKVSGQRIKQELDKILSTSIAQSAESSAKKAKQGTELLDKLNLLENILPELTKLKKIAQSKDFHAEGSAFIHSLLVLENIKENDLALRYAALLHDLGKFSTAQKNKRNGRVHISFIGHAQKGAEIFQLIAARLRFSNAEKRHVTYLIKHHMDLQHLDTMSAKTIQKLAKNKDFRDLVTLRIADNLGSYLTNKAGKRIRENANPWKKYFEIADRIKAIKIKKLISGHDVMRALKIKSGKKIGAILEHIEEMQITGEIKTRAQALATIKKVAKTLDNNI